MKKAKQLEKYDPSSVEGKWPHSAKASRGKQNYDPVSIEKKWQKVWKKEGLYQAKDFDKRPKFYTLIEFPYPSGAGLHVGHVRSWSAMDAYSRRKRMQGFNVLYPIGWDAFGLPAENYAIKNKIHPSVAVAENIANFKRQIKSLGLSFDWSREVNTTDAKYYKWTQWIFLKFFEKGLAYQADVPVNWCSSCKTNLADEEVLPDGTHERCGNQTEKRMQKQWLLKITAYADRLLEDLNLVDYSPKIATQQVNWIGKKEGINIKYQIVLDSSEASLKQYSLSEVEKYIECFTTRPDTNFGATFIVIGPEHPFVASLLSGKINSSSSEVQSDESRSKVEDSSRLSRLWQDRSNHKGNLEEIGDYVEKAKKKNEQERIAEGRKKTGVFTGFYVINNLNGKKLPIYISDFVLGNVGTGAVVGVPGHDQRDYEFAKEFNLPIEIVVVPSEKSKIKNCHAEFSSASRNKFKPVSTNEILKQVQDDINQGRVYEGEGVVVNSDFLNGLSTQQATKKIMDYLEEKRWGKRVTTYHLRDWVFSRQHYWGEPIPIIYCENCAKKRGHPEYIRCHSELVSESNSSVVKMPKQVRHDKGKDQHDKGKWTEGWDYRIIEGKEYAIIPVPEKDLPVELPYLEQYEPSGTGESPLAKVDTWVNVSCPVCGSKARRETDTMPNWAGSNWYYLAYLFASKLGDQKSKIPTSLKLRGASKNQKYEDNVFKENQGQIKYWMPVDIYQGGFEHTTLHLLYSRFVYKFLYDIGVVPTPEPYAKRRSHGIVLGPDGRKMSKSFGNVINPDDIAKKFGADTLRVYEMFMGPFDQTIAWSEESVEGCYRFLKRVWQMSLTKVINRSDTYSSSEERSDESRSKAGDGSRQGTYNKFTFQARTIDFNKKTSVSLLSKLHKTIKKVDEDLENMKFNTAVASMMEFINSWQADEVGLNVEDAKKFLLILTPFAPHLTEELYQRVMNHESGIMEEKAHYSLFVIHNSVHAQPWPQYDPSFIEEGESTIVVQVNGKVRDTIKFQIPACRQAGSNLKSQISNEERKKQIEQMAMESDNVKRHLEGKQVKKVVYVEGRIINFVTE